MSKSQVSGASLEILRQSAASGTESTESILQSVADMGLFLAFADGVAIALRKDGIMTCQARSGEIAPELGVPLNANSGISGECVRRATIMICRDAETDTHVDSEVCSRLGIRSIVALPLRGRMAVFGILEAFSAYPDAFRAEQISSLQALSEIAAQACERDQPSQISTLIPEPSAAGLPAALAASTEVVRAFWTKVSGKLPESKRYWIYGSAAAVVLSVALLWLIPWRHSTVQTATSNPGAQNGSTASGVPVHPPPIPVPVKAESSANIRPSDRLTTKDVLRNAAEIHPTVSRAETSRSAGGTPPGTNTENTNSPPGAGDSSTDTPPSVDLTTSPANDDLVRMASGSPTLPTFGASVSEGVVEAKLVHQVNPVYPLQARAQKLAGPVTLDATISRDGSIKSVNIVSGPPLLSGAAASAIRQWRYTPSLLNGKAIEAQKRITIVFRLQ